MKNLKNAAHVNEWHFFLSSQFYVFFFLIDIIFTKKYSHANKP